VAPTPTVDPGKGKGVMASSPPAGKAGGKPEMLFSIVQDDPRPRLKDKLGPGASHLGSAKVVLSSDPLSELILIKTLALASVTTIDYYEDADGHTHVVLGIYTSEGWEILTDISL
jgi:hypothetical protein